MKKKNLTVAFCAALLGAFIAPAIAAPTVAIDGPDQLLLVAPANLGNTNFNRANVDHRQLAAGRLAELLAPTIQSAAEECKAADVAAITLHAQNVPDRIGGTTTRYGGLGIYVNLASADRNSAGGTWYLAPFFAFEGEITTTGGAKEPIELFGLAKVYPQASDKTTQEDFMRVSTPAVEGSLTKFVAGNLAQAVKKALASHCQVR